MMGRRMDLLRNVAFVGLLGASYFIPLVIALDQVSVAKAAAAKAAAATAECERRIKEIQVILVQERGAPVEDPGCGFACERRQCVDRCQECYQMVWPVHERVRVHDNARR